MEKKIEFLRNKIGYSRKYIAENVCDESTIYRIEKDLQIPRLDVLQKICQKLNVSVDYLLSLDDESKSYMYINKLKKLCREFLYQQEYHSIEYLIEEADIYLKNNPNIYDNDFQRFIDWQKAILVHKINRQPMKAKMMLHRLLGNKIINELDINIANSLALIFLDLENEEAAYDLLNEGLKMLERLPVVEDKTLLPRVYYNLTYLFYDWEKYDECIDFGHRLEYYLTSNHLFYSIGELFHLLGITYEKKKMLDTSYYYLKKAATIFLTEDKVNYHIRTNIALSEICFRMDKYSEGNQLMENVLEQIRSLPDHNLASIFSNKVQTVKERYSVSSNN